jgi:acyl-CoA dehydrogenase
MAARDIRALPKLEGTVHVNMALIIKFIRNYFFNPGEFPKIPRVTEPRDDSFLFAQGPTKGLGRIKFHDVNIAYGGVDLPNVNVFKEQIEVFKEFLIASATDPAAAESQSKDIGFLLSMGELFTLVAYGQLIIEYRDLQPEDVSDDLLDQIFDFMVRDFSKFALEIHQKHNASEGQMAICQRMIRKPVVNQERFTRIFDEHVFALKGAYQMND